MITHIEKVIFADIFNHTIKPTINPFWNHVEVLFGLGDNFTFLYQSPVVMNLISIITI